MSTVRSSLNRRFFFPVAVGALASIFAMACTTRTIVRASDTEPSDEGSETEKEDAKATPKACDTPKSQAVSQPCCTSWGIDACGANLFCAAFDGREQATCYPERSRLDMTECDEDRQCASGECNVEAGQCKSMPSQACSPEVGCAGMENSGNRFSCDERTSLPRCELVSDHAPGGEFCERDGDCRSGRCAGQTCMGASNDPCTSDAYCATGRCVKYEYSIYNGAAKNTEQRCASRLGESCAVKEQCPSSTQCVNCGASNVTCAGGETIGLQCLKACSAYPNHYFAVSCK